MGKGGALMPVLAATMPVPAGFVCPHCGRSVTDGHQPVPVLADGHQAVAPSVEPPPVVPVLAVPQALPVAPVVEPVKVSKPKKSRGNTPQN